MRLYQIAVLLLIVISPSVWSQDIKVTGSIDYVMKPSQFKPLAQASAPRHIKLLKLKLSKNATDLLLKRSHVLAKHQFSAGLTRLPERIELGMNGVPVLDQGNFGTCVTFANTAAIDALLGKGDYISQTCLLQLGNHLEQNGYGESGWDGSIGAVVLHQLASFGFVSKAQEQSVGCGGLFAYPSNDKPIPNTAIDLKSYHELSEPLEFEEGQIVSLPILDMYKGILERTDTTKTIEEIKLALSQGDRVSMGVLLLDFDLGMVGAVGRHHANFDSWVLTPEIERDLILRPDFGGHEMVITGYDDNAVAIDEQGRSHRGLFTLRNSWGSDVGDKGDFYMSYDYYRVLALEAHRIMALIG